MSTTVDHYPKGKPRGRLQRCPTRTRVLANPARGRGGARCRSARRGAQGGAHGRLLDNSTHDRREDRRALQRR